MGSLTDARTQSRWRTITLMLAAALVATMTTTALTAQEDSGEEFADEPDRVTTRDTTPDATADDLSDQQVAELGGQDTAAAQLAQTAATDGTFNTNRAVYTPRSEPCVLFDTRSGSKLSPGSTTTFSRVGGNNIGGDSGCNVSSSALAAHINLVAIQPNNAGNLKMWAASESEPNGGIVNFQDLSPSMNNSNAFVVTSAPAGFKVKVNGGPVHVRAVLMGNFFDGGSTFAAARHDHLVKQASGGAVFATGDETTIRSMTFNISDECNQIFTEEHNVAIDFTGYVENGGPSDSLVETDIQLFVDGSIQAAATTEIEFEAPTVFETETFGKRWLVDMGSGSHTIEIRANAESSNTDYLVDADIVAERLGWTCTLT